MITQKTFCEVMRLIKEQEEIYEQVGKALNSVLDGHFIVGSENKFLEALFLVLKEVLRDEDDFIFWWLYEDVEKIIYTSFDAESKTLDLTEPEALYDYIINNYTTNKGD